MESSFHSWELNCSIPKLCVCVSANGHAGAETKREPRDSGSGIHACMHADAYVQNNARQNKDALHGGRVFDSFTWIRTAAACKIKNLVRLIRLEEEEEE